MVIFHSYVSLPEGNHNLGFGGSKNKTLVLSSIPQSWWKSSEIISLENQKKPFPQIPENPNEIHQNYTIWLCNIAMERSPFLSSVNHLFLWAIFHGYVK
jgi:hypothetical protein